MTNSPICKDVVQGLHGLSDAAWLEAVSQAREVTYPANAEVFSAGDICTSFLLVMRGAIRVNKVLENGRELVLYRVQTGECCSLTALKRGTRARFPVGAYRLYQ